MNAINLRCRSFNGFAISLNPLAFRHRSPSPRILPSISEISATPKPE
jgi:hypothetical protein